ncbi:MAG: SpoIIE family protein phosphatase [Kiritimatiellae bacterium]|nr:SpoIIE family protein phosphatase [Kiritimatiellia bacterium]
MLKEGHGAFRAVITDIMMGDIQGHGTSAALAMTAVQSFLKRFKTRSATAPSITPADIANMLQKFFLANGWRKPRLNALASPRPHLSVVGLATTFLQPVDNF